MRGLPLIVASALLAGCTAAPAATVPSPVEQRSVSPGKASPTKPGAVAPPATRLPPAPLPAQTTRTPDLVAKTLPSLIGNDGSTLIGMDGSTLLGNEGSTFRRGGNLGAMFPGEPGGLPSGPAMEKGKTPVPEDRVIPAPEDRVIPVPVAADTVFAGALAGTLRLPAAIAKPGRTDQLAVRGARVALCQLDSTNPIDDPVVTDDKGAFTIAGGSVPVGLYAARGTVKVGDAVYVLAALVRVDKAGTPAIELDAGSTLVAARAERAFFDSRPALDEPGFDPAAWNTAARAYGGHVPPAALRQAATEAERNAAWAAFAKDQPAMQADDLVEAFVVAREKAAAPGATK